MSVVMNSIMLPYIKEFHKNGEKYTVVTVVTVVTAALKAKQQTPSLGRMSAFGPRR